jgi:hypothetical protein
MDLLSMAANENEDLSKACCLNSPMFSLISKCGTKLY